MSYQLVVDCPDEISTQQVGVKIAQQLKSGDLVELVGDVGAGKTTFVKGLAHGVGSKDQVSSPSFALKNVYEGSRLALHHYDLYRLEEPGLIEHEIIDSLEEPDTAVVIEWAKISDAILPPERIIIEFSLVAEDKRQLKITLPKEKGKNEWF